MTEWDAAGFNRELAAAVDTYDRTRVGELCDRLIQHLRVSDVRYSATAGRALLRQLRRKRLFGLVTRTAEALLQSGQRDPAIRCEYAHALTDQDMPTAAVEILMSLVNESIDPVIRAEAEGMLARAYKDMCLQAAAPGTGRHRDLLAVAIATYAGPYRTDPGGCAWHGINAAALIRYAERHALDIDAGLDAGQVAGRVLADVQDRSLDPEAAPGPWEAALAAESNLVLGRPDEAVRWMQRYAVDGRVDAFELTSTLRQLTEVWQLDATSEPGCRLLPILRAQSLTRQEGASLNLAPQDSGSVARSDPDAAFERVLGDAGLVTHSWYRRGLIRSRAVALVRHSSGRAVGTGFLIRAGDLKDRWSDLGTVLITNSHVISPEPASEDTLRPEQARIAFQVAAADGVAPPEVSVEVALWSSPPRQLDCTLVRLATSTEDIEPCPITPFRPRLDGKQRVYVIGHPEGRELSYSIDDNLLLDQDERVIHYRAPTEHGSSGSPVFNRDWEVIGLHHAGRNDMPRLHGEPGSYPANEGIWIQAIRRAINGE